MEEKRILQIENAPRADVAAPREKKKKKQENPPNFKQPLAFGW